MSLEIQTLAMHLGPRQKRVRLTLQTGFLPNSPNHPEEGFVRNLEGQRNHSHLLGIGFSSQKFLLYFQASSIAK